MNSRLAAPRFSAIYTLQGSASAVQHEMKQIMTGLGPPLLYAVDDDQNGQFGVVLTDRDVDAFWRTQPDCQMPSFPNTHPKRRFQSFLARLWPPNYLTWLGNIQSMHQTRRELASDLIDFPAMVLKYARTQQRDANGEPIQRLASKS